MKKKGKRWGSAPAKLLESIFLASASVSYQNLKLCLSWARAPSPCCSLLSARLPLCGHLGRNVPGAPLHRGHLAASAAATRQPKSPFYTIPKSEKTTPPGPYHDDFKSRHRAPLQLKPEVPEVSESLTGNRGGGPKRASGRTNLSVWRARSPLGTAGLWSLHRRLVSVH